MNYAKKTVKILFLSLVLLFIVLVSIGVFLLTTTPGLYAVSKAVNYFAPGHLVLEGISGELSNHFSIKKITYEDHGFKTELVNTEISWHLNQLLKHSLVIDKLSIALIRIRDRSQNTPVTQDSSSFSLPELPLEVHIKKAHIKRLLIHSIPAIRRINLSVNLTAKQWQISQLDLQFLDQLLVAKSTIKPVFPFTITGIVSTEPTVHDKKPSFPVEGFFNFSGDFHHYQIKGHYTQPNLVDFNADLLEGRHLNAMLTWQNFNWLVNDSTAVISDRGQLTMQGELPHLMVNLHSHLVSPYESTLNLKANASPDLINAEALLQGPWGKFKLISDYNANNHPLMEGSLTGSIHTTFNELLSSLTINTQFQGNDAASLTAYSHINGLYNGNKLALSVRYQPGNLSAQAHLGANQLTLNSKQFKQWQFNAMFPQPDILHPALTHLKTTIAIDGCLDNLAQGELNLAISKGQWQPLDSPVIPFKGGQIKTTLNSTELNSQGSLALDDDKKLELRIKLPQFSLQTQDFNHQSINGFIKLTANSLSFVNDLSPMVNHVQGQLDATLNIKGKLVQPKIEGSMHLLHGAVDIPLLNTHIEPINLTLESSGSNWTAEGQLYSRDRPLTLNGKGQFSPSLTGNINIRGDRFSIINTSEYQIEISPTMTIDILSTGLKINGHILVPNALIKPQTFTESVNLSDDVIFVEDKAPANETSFDTDITIEMGKNVVLAVKGLKGFLEGSVRLQQQAGGPLNGSGELSIREGKYEAYGQNLTIDKGMLTFTGGQVSNPGIQVRAIRQFNNTSSSFDGSNQLFDFDSSNLQSIDLSGKTSVGIEVTGRLDSPKVQLYSSPSGLSQADILSLLLLGKPANQANKSGAQLLYTAISALNLNSGTKGTQLLSQLKDKLGVEFSIENNSEYDKKSNQVSDNTAFVIGKSISPRLYLSYNLGLSQNDSNALTLKYLLNKFFSVQVNVSTESSGVDVLYTRQVDSLFKKKIVLPTVNH